MKQTLQLSVENLKVLGIQFLHRKKNLSLFPFQIFLILQNYVLMHLSLKMTLFCLEYLNQFIKSNLTFYKKLYTLHTVKYTLVGWFGALRSVFC